MDAFSRKVCPTTLEPGDLVPLVGTVAAVHVFPEHETRWTARVTWDDGACTLYPRRDCRVERITAAELRNAAQVCIVEASQDLQEVK